MKATRRKATKPAATRMGRPAHIRGKSATMTIRLTPQLRARLEERAVEQRLTLSDAAAILLERGLAVIVR